MGILRLLSRVYGVNSSITCFQLCITFAREMTRHENHHPLVSLLHLSFSSLNWTTILWYYDTIIFIKLKTILTKERVNIFQLQNPLQILQLLVLITWMKRTQYLFNFRIQAVSYTCKIISCLLHLLLDTQIIWMSTLLFTAVRCTWWKTSVALKKILNWNL